MPQAENEKEIEEFFKIFDFQLEKDEIKSINNLNEMCHVTEDN